jgi:hypothetical protein
MAGSTNHMQSRLDNGEVVVTYRDGTTARLALHNPTNWWPIDQDYFIDDYQFSRPEPIPPRVDLKTGQVRLLDVATFKGKGRAVRGGAATVLDLPLDPTKELQSLTVRTLANEVVIGLMGLTLARAAPGDTAYLFTYFTGNGEDGLHLAWSADGYKWEALNGGKSCLTSTIGKEKLMRDPCVVRGPDGTYHMVWTSGWWENNIGYASTKDFITWSEPRKLPVMAHEPTVRNSWAPEVACDEKRQEFIIFWSSTIPGRFPDAGGASEDQLNHCLYFTTTKDFVNLARTKLLYDPGFSVIDATFLATGDGLRLIIKDERRLPEPKKYLQMARAADLRGPFTDLSEPFTPKGLWVEGPTALRIGDDYVVYFDAYAQKHYGALRSRDLKTWEDVTAQMSFPDEGTPVRMRHGTAIAVPAEIVARLRAAGVPAVAAPATGK